MLFSNFLLGGAAALLLLPSSIVATPLPLNNKRATTNSSTSSTDSVTASSSPVTEDNANGLTKQQLLALSPSRHSRSSLLSDTDYLFDFGNQPAQPNTNFAGGHLVLADIDTFPALEKQSVGMALGFLAPCGYNTPHTHPGGTEFLVAVNATFHTMVSLEPLSIDSGAAPRVVQQQLQPLQGTFFPQGSTHAEFNPGCETALFVSAFGAEDFGRIQVLSSFFALPDDAVLDAFADWVTTETVKGLAGDVPDSVAFGIAQCQKRCNIPS